MNVHLDCRGGGSTNRNASGDESVETGNKSVETRDESIEAREKHNNHVMICSYAMLSPFNAFGRRDFNSWRFVPISEFVITATNIHYHTVSSLEHDIE